jgi:Cu(I)/Ag(I) efflux system membrane fusion protein
MRSISWRSRRTQIGAVALVLAVIVIAALVARRGQSASGVSGRNRGAQNASRMPSIAGKTMTNGGAVTFTADQIRQFGITFGSVEVRPLTTETRTTGVVTVDETAVTQVAPKFGGFVERLHVNFTGQPVQRGDALLDIYSPELVAAQQELLLAGQLQRQIGRSAVPGVPASTTDLVDAARRRLRLWDVSDAQIDEVLRTGQARRTVTLYAPSSGVVIDKKVVEGQSIQPGDHLYTIANLSSVWVEIPLREVDAAAIRPGSGADIELVSLPGRPFKGRVAYIYPTLDSASRAVRARVVVSNTNGVLKPGMYATVRLETPSRSALTVPNTAVLHTGDRNVVFVDMGRGRLMPLDVELGRAAGDYTEVLAGLEPGQRVVTSAQFLLDSESNLGEVLRAMMGQMTGSDVGRTGNMSNMPGMNTAPAPVSDKGADMRGMPAMKTPPPTKR